MIRLKQQLQIVELAKSNETSTGLELMSPTEGLGTAINWMTDKAKYYEDQESLSGFYYLN